MKDYLIVPESCAALPAAVVEATSEKDALWKYVGTFPDDCIEHMRSVCDNGDPDYWKSPLDDDALKIMFFEGKQDLTIEPLENFRINRNGAEE